jgi:hypothetical protein
MYSWRGESSPAGAAVDAGRLGVSGAARGTVTLGAANGVAGRSAEIPGARRTSGM